MYPKDKGKKDFQPNCISWSYLYLGKVALVTIKKITPKISLKLNHKLPGKIENGNILKIGNHPPKNRIAAKELIKSMFEYSAKKKSANVMAEYSTL